MVPVKVVYIVTSAVVVMSFLLGYWYCSVSTKEVTPSASHNNAKNAIAQVHEFARRTTGKPIGHSRFITYLEWLEQQLP